MKRLLLLIIAILTLGLLPTWIQYGGFFWDSDFPNQIIPFILETKRMFSSGIPFWSWCTYLGADFLASYSYYTITSPFVWINCLFPYEYLELSILLTLYLKFLCIGAVSYFYFRKINISNTYSELGSLLFTFSTFVLVKLGYYMFLEPIICFPIFMMAIERRFRKERYSKTTLILASFLVVFSNFYFSLFTFLLAFVFSICRLSTSDKNRKVGFAISSILCVLCGIALCAPVLFPTISCLMHGERTGSTFFESYSILSRVENLLMPKIKEGIVPIYGFEIETYTSGSIAIFGTLLSFLYVKNNLKNNDALAYSLIALFILYISPLNGVFTLCSSLK